MIMTKKKIRQWLIEHPRLNPYKFSINILFRYLTLPLRVNPDFIIIGFHKSGTTSLYNYLIQHPNIESASEKELEFFSYAYDRGMSYYKLQFPTKIKKWLIERKTKNKFLTGEASPAYSYHPYAPERIKKNLPNVKLIVLLRNPIDRAYSDYNQDIRRDWQPNVSFEDAISQENSHYKKMMSELKNDLIKHHNVNWKRKGYLTIGKYVIHLEKWIKLFGKEQIFFINTFDLENNLENTLKSLYEFLGVHYIQPQNLSKKNVGKYNKMLSSTRENLIEYYKEYNKQLEDMLSLKFNWN
jgi:hypothetical protein